MLSQALPKEKEGDDVRNFLKGQAGFIFIDALVGMVILTVALTALAVAYRQATITTVAARNYNNAVYLAQEAVEELKKNDGQLAAAFTTTLTNSKITINNVGYSITPSTTDLSATLKEVKISVSWPNNTHSPPVELVSYYYLSP